jgi:hypothetical protein
MDRLVRRRAAPSSAGPPPARPSSIGPLPVIPPAGRPPALRRANRARLLRLSFVIAVLIALALVSRTQDVSGSSAGTGNPPGAGASPAQAARSAAQTHLGMLSGGDWPAVWGGWSADARRQVPRATYVRTHRTCHPLLAVPLQAVQVLRLDRRTADVRWRGGGRSGTLHMVSEGDAWRVAPTATQLIPYAEGPKAAVIELRRRGECARR